MHRHVCGIDLLIQLSERKQKIISPKMLNECLKMYLQCDLIPTWTGGVVSVDWLHIPPDVSAALSLIQHEAALLLHQNTPYITVVLWLHTCTRSILTGDCNHWWI